MKLPDKVPYDPLTHRDAHFINVLYCTPVGRLIDMDKARLQHALAKAKRVCHWLEGILNLVNQLESRGGK